VILERPGARQKKPDIVVIFGDDIGVWNISAYYLGMMAGSTPNIDRIAKKALSSRTTMRRNPVRLDAPPSSRANIPFELAC
jgi:hypothetical protein